MKTLALSILLLCAAAGAQEGQSKVYLINTLRFGYPKIHFEIDGQRINVKRDQYVAVEVQPGEHSLRAGNFKKKPTTFLAEPGKAYYFTIDEKAMGWGGFQISELGDNSGSFQVRNLKAQKQ